LFLAKAQWSV